MNRWFGIGRLTKDAELKYTQDGSAIAKFSIAVNRRKGKDGTEKVDFFDVTAWGKMAEGLMQYLIKGKQVSIEGRLQQDRWTDEAGAQHSRIGIVADNIQLLGGTRVDLPPQQQAPQYQQQPAPYQPAPQYQQPQQYQQQGLGFPEDIPF
jgi:single stranded DNA-binding protein